MIRKIEIINSSEQVLHIQFASYKVEADLIGYSDIPPLKDTTESLIGSRETFYGYYKDEILCGIISYKLQDNVLDIHRLMVHPSFFRLGIAKKLLDYVFGINDVEKAIVSTALLNEPAIRFYEKYGFQKEKEIKVNENLSLVTFQMRCKK